MVNTPPRMGKGGDVSRPGGGAGGNAAERFVNSKAADVLAKTHPALQAALQAARIGSAVKSTASRNSGGSSRGKWAAGGGAMVFFVGIMSISILITIVGAIGGLLGGMSALTAGGAGASAALSCYNDASAPSGEAVADIPAVALDAYEKAAQASGVDWIYIAGIGKIETNHGRIGGRHLNRKGNERPTGIVNSLGASGPMQFLPATFAEYAHDGNFDGTTDIQNVYDAAFATGFMLKADGAPQDIQKAIFAYNHATWYVDEVMAQAEKYQAAATDAPSTATNTADTTSAHRSSAHRSSATTATAVSGNTTATTAVAFAHPVAARLAAAVQPVAKKNPSSPSSPGESTGGVTTGGLQWVQPLKAGTYVNTAGFLAPGSMWSGGWGVPAGHHTGYDYAAPTGTPVYAIADGTIKYDPGSSSWAGPNLLLIDHGNLPGYGDVVSWYAHLSGRAAGIHEGMHVKAGDLIGYVGAMGNVTGPHLHLQVVINGKAVDPKTWLAGAGAPSGSVASDGCTNTGTSGVVGGNGAWGGYQNGQIPLSALCKIPFSTQYLECNAEKALEALDVAYKAQFGHDMAVTDGYRSYAQQVACRQQKGDLCATPGTSNHGWGLAVDLGDGVNSYSSDQYKWMKANAPDYAWAHPSWAEPNGSKPEPWHWEFQGTGQTAEGSNPGNAHEPQPVPWNSFYHMDHPYRAGNSIRGLNAAVNQGYHEIDLDANVTKDGVVVNTHWAEPMVFDDFYDPEGKIGAHTRIDQMTWAQVSRLRSHDGYQILPMSQMLQEAAKRGLRVEIELKDSPGFEDPTVMGQLYADAVASQAKFFTKTISNLGHAKKRLEVAHGIGFTTVILPRGNDQVPKSWWPYIDYVRGHVVWTDN